ncbi:MAG: hypothetical protein CMC77_02745 [Flavobacteriaceae bacterium]|nr:hypothetical protein [Flavobacteriaceae bacterium]
MKVNKFLIIIFCIMSCFLTQSQNKPIKNDNTFVVQTKTKPDKMNPLRPAKAAFYSAALPGLGQAYNKKYWKIPIVYGAIGTALYFYFDNDKVYDRYRNAYKRRLAGFTDDEFYGPGETPFISEDALIRAQRTLKRNKEMSMLIAVGLYALNIIDANVDAHLLQYNMDENLSFKPYINFNNSNYNAQIGLSFNLKL